MFRMKRLRVEVGRRKGKVEEGRYPWGERCGRVLAGIGAFTVETSKSSTYPRLATAND